MRSDPYKSPLAAVSARVMGLSENSGKAVELMQYFKDTDEYGAQLVDETKYVY